MSASVSVTKKQGSTMGTVIAKVSDPQNKVHEVNFYLRVGTAARLGPYPPDIVRRPLSGAYHGVYEKDFVLDTEQDTVVETEALLEDGTPVANVAPQTFGVRTASTASGVSLQVQDADTPPTAVATLAFEGTVVSVQQGVASFSLDSRYALLGHTHAYLPLAGGSLSGRLVVSLDTANPGHNSGQAELRTQDGSPVALGFHRAGHTGVALRHGEAGRLDLYDQGMGWAQYRGGSFWATASRFYGSDGALLYLDNDAAALFSSGGGALGGRLGSLLVSHSYAHASQVPANGIWSLGLVATATGVRAQNLDLGVGAYSNTLRANDGGHVWLQVGVSGAVNVGDPASTTCKLNVGGDVYAQTAVLANGVACNPGLSGAAGGLSLYGQMDTAYGIFFRGQSHGSSWGGHGYVSGDWATYLTMNNVGDARGWIFRAVHTSAGGPAGNVASISAAGRAAFQRVYSAESMNVGPGQYYQCNSNTWYGDNQLAFGWGGGIHMSDATWVRVSNQKSFTAQNLKADAYLYAGDANTRLASGYNYWYSQSGYGMHFSNHAGAQQGYLYFDGAGSFGLLHSAGEWAVRTWNGGVELYGSAVASGGIRGQYVAVGVGAYTHTIRASDGGMLYLQVDAGALNVGVPSVTSYKLNVAGDMYAQGAAYAQAFYTTSTRDAKQDIRPFPEDALALLNGVDVVEFTYRGDEQKARRVGFIAEDTDSLLSGREQKHMDQANTLALLIRAVQELSARCGVAAAPAHAGA